MEKGSASDLTIFSLPPTYGVVADNNCNTASQSSTKVVPPPGLSAPPPVALHENSFDVLSRNYFDLASHSGPYSEAKTCEANEPDNSREDPSIEAFITKFSRVRKSELSYPSTAKSCVPISTNAEGVLPSLKTTISSSRSVFQEEIPSSSSSSSLRNRRFAFVPLHTVLKWALKKMNAPDVDSTCDHMVKTLKQQWITTAEQVCALTPEQCRDHRLPLLLPQAVEQALQHFRERQHLFNDMSRLCHPSEKPVVHVSSLYKGDSHGDPQLLFKKSKMTVNSQGDMPTSLCSLGHNKRQLLSSKTSGASLNVASAVPQYFHPRRSSNFQDINTRQDKNTHHDPRYSSTMNFSTSQDDLTFPFARPTLKGDSEFTRRLSHNNLSWNKFGNNDRAYGNQDVCCFGCGCSLSKCLCKDNCS